MAQAQIQQQSSRPPMDHRLLEAVTNGSADEVIRLMKTAQSPAPAADHVATISIPDQGVTSDWDGVLHLASRRKHFDLVGDIPKLCGAADVAAKNRRGETPLHCAAASGNDRMIVHLISMAIGNDKKRELLRMGKHNGETCLHDAVRCGKIDAVRTLVEEDVKVFCGPNDGSALVKIHDIHGVSPLYLATTLRKLEIVQFLTQKQRSNTDEVYPTASYVGPGSKTALHAAVLLSSELSERLATWKNELMGKVDASGNTPFHLLASTENRHIAKLLLRMDASAGYRADAEGSLPIHVAAANGSLGIVKLLSKLRPGCSWSCNIFGQTILHIAVQKRRYNVVKYLCSGNNFVSIYNTRDRDGNTALHLAVLQGNQFIFCRLLQRREVCLSFTNKEAHTPLDLAQLSLPAALPFSPSPRQWIMYDLVLAGADYGTCRVDQFVTDMVQPDKEKEVKSAVKSAGLVGLCAVLIWNIAFAVPFAVTPMYREQENLDEYGELSWAIAYRLFMASDVMAFAFASVATAYCTFAGLSFTDSKTRLFYLTGAGISLRYAAMSLMIVFLTGVYVVVALVDYWIPIIILPFGALAIIPQLVPVFLMLLHAWTLLWRLGFLTWCLSLFCLLPRQRRDRVPPRYRRLCVSSLIVVFSVVFVCGIIYQCASLSAHHLVE